MSLKYMKCNSNRKHIIPKDIIQVHIASLYLELSVAISHLSQVPSNLYRHLSIFHVFLYLSFLDSSVNKNFNSHLL